MDVKKFSMQVSIPQIENKAPIFSDSDVDQIAKESDLIEYARKFDGEMVTMEVSSTMTVDSEGAKSHLRKEAILQEASVLRRLMGTKLFGNKRPRAVATGSVKVDEEKWINNRAIDLVEGLLIWQDEIKTPYSIMDSVDIYDQLLVQIVGDTRQSYIKTEDLRNER